MTQTIDLGLVKGEPGFGVPKPGVSDVGKVPVVNKTGDSYELVEIGGSSGEEKQWELIKQISLSEPVRTVTIDTDDRGVPFEVSELFVRAWLTCGESSRKKANIGVNGSSQNLAGNLEIIKNTGYFGPCEIHIFEQLGMFKADVIYTDATTPNDPPALYNLISSARATALYTFPSVAYDKITGFGIMCTDSSVTFSEKCLIQVYGR